MHCSTEVTQVDILMQSAAINFRAITVTRLALSLAVVVVIMAMSSAASSSAGSLSGSKGLAKSNSVDSCLSEWALRMNSMMQDLVAIGGPSASDSHAALAATDLNDYFEVF